MFLHLCPSMNNKKVEVLKNRQWHSVALYDGMSRRKHVQTTSFGASAPLSDINLSGTQTVAFEINTKTSLKYRNFRFYFFIAMTGMKTKASLTTFILLLAVFYQVYVKSL